MFTAWTGGTRRLEFKPCKQPSDCAESFAADKAVFVYRDGEKGNWDLASPVASNKDIAFFDALLAELESKLCIDTKRVFATGSSMGAYLTNQLGCRRGDVLRAIVPHAGGGPWETGGTYHGDGQLACAQKPVAAMIFIGLADTTSIRARARRASRTGRGPTAAARRRRPSRPALAWRSRAARTQS